MKLQLTINIHHFEGGNVSKKNERRFEYRQHYEANPGPDPSPGEQIMRGSKPKSNFIRTRSRVVLLYIVRQRYDGGVDVAVAAVTYTSHTSN